MDWPDIVYSIHKSQFLITKLGFEALTVLAVTIEDCEVGLLDKKGDTVA